jgi:hypothetical protein
VLYQLFLREFSLALQLEDIGYVQQRNIPYQRGDNVLIKVNETMETRYNIRTNRCIQL